MEEKQIIKYSNGIVDLLSRLPGIVGFANPEPLEEKNKKLSSSNAHKAINLLEMSNKIAIKIFIIVSMNISNYLISKEILEAINFYFKKQGVKIKSIDIFIKGSE
jgi:hypothetical protein